MAHHLRGRCRGDAPHRLAAADAIVLSFNFVAAVSRDHLHIVGWKPQLVVSNGDILLGGATR